MKRRSSSWKWATRAITWRLETAKEMALGVEALALLQALRAAIREPAAPRRARRRRP